MKQENEKRSSLGSVQSVWVHFGVLPQMGPSLPQDKVFLASEAKDTSRHFCRRLPLFRPNKPDGAIRKTTNQSMSKFTRCREGQGA